MDSNEVSTYDFNADTGLPERTRTTIENDDEGEQTFVTPMEFLYLTVYEVDRAYGGAEEGGWWYDTGEPIAAIPVTSQEQYDREAQRMREMFPNSKRLGGTRYAINLEGEWPRPYPAVRPHYE